MKKTMTRIAACSLAVLIAFNTIAIPKSKAVVAETATATSVLAAYLAATGMPLMVVEGGAAAAAAGTASLVSGYAAATGGTYSVVTSAIASGVTIGTGGAILIGVAAAAVLAGIAAWAINKYGLIDDNGVPVEFPVSVISVHSVRLADGTAMPFLSSEYFDMIVDSACDMSSYELERKVYNFVTGYSLSLENEIIRLFDSTGAQVGSGFYYYPDSKLYLLNQDGELLVTAYSPSRDQYVNASFLNTDIFSYMKFDDVCGSSFVTDADCSVGLPADYTPFELPESSQLIIETGLSPEIAPESVPQAIFNSVGQQTFAPSYSIIPGTHAGTTDPVDPDTPSSDPSLDGTDVSVGFLQRIANACEALGDKIINGIKSIFVPDAALTTKITNAFSEKFAFVPQLHALGVDLLNLTPDSEPPVIWIHLEDTEGSINYGGTVKALDMSWYERYKEDGDRIIGGFLWLGFLWTLFMRVSDIINGAGMVYAIFPEAHSIDFEFDDTPRLPPPRKRPRGKVR